MISHADMVTTARSYLRAARLLNRKGSSSPDASVYLCGYAVEIALKARICRTLGWVDYLETTKEFQDLRSFQTHNLDVLLRLCGMEARLLGDPMMFVEWSVVRKWTPEQRYKPLGTKTAKDALDMIEATAKALKVLL